MNTGGFKIDTGAEQPNESVQNGAQTPNGSALSFAAAAGAMSSHLGIDGDIKQFADNMSAFINTANIPAKVVVVKKGTEGIFYTNIAIILTSGKTAIYHTLLMANTGVTQLRATEVLDHYKNHGVKGPLVLPALSIESNLHATIESEIRKRGAVADDVKLISADGLRIVEKNLDETYSAKIAMTVLKYLSALVNTLNGSYDDTALNQALREFDSVRVDITPVNDGAMDFLGETRYVNFMTKSVGVNAGVIDYNRGGDELTVAQTAGNVTLMIASKGKPKQSKNDSGLIAVPVITVNTIDLTVPSLGSVLFAIYQSTILAAGDRWIKIIVDGMTDENGAPIQGRDPGVLEKYINSLELDKPQAVSLAKEKNEATVYEFIKRMSSESPVIALENILYGMGSSETALFTVAADNSSPNRLAACKKIIEAANKITGGAFDLNFNPDMIFHSPKISLPTGAFVARQGTVKSIDEIETMFVATADKNDGLLEQYMHIESSPGKFLAKVEFLANLESTTRRKFNIDGEKIRMILSDTFVSTLFAAMNSTGVRIDATEAPTMNNRHDFIPLSQLGGGLSQDILHSSIGAQAGANTGFSLGNLGSMTGGLI